MKDVEISLNEKRLLSVLEFQRYASIGRNNAFKLARISGARIQVGRRVLVDRVKFDEWVDFQTGKNGK